MREILFRGKRKDNGEWVEGYFVSEGNDAYIFEPREVTKGIDIGGTLDCCEMREVISDTVGQYIGLKDKHGRMIFEDDIIKEQYAAWARDTVHMVEWDDNSCGFEPFSDSRENCGHCGGGLSPEYCEVIGNIHDNLELLEGGSKHK